MGFQLAAVLVPPLVQYLTNNVMLMEIYQFVSGTRERPVYFQIENEKFQPSWGNLHFI